MAPPRISAMTQFSGPAERRRAVWRAGDWRIYATGVRELGGRRTVRLGPASFTALTRLPGQGRSMPASSERAELDLSGDDAAALWRQAAEERRLPLLFAAIGPDAGFTGRYTAAVLGDVAVVDVRAQPLLLRDRAPAANEAPMVVLQVVVMG